MKFLQTLLCLLITVVFANHNTFAETNIAPGRYTAELKTPGGPIRFELSLARKNNIWTGTIQNPLEPIRIPTVRVDGSTLALSFPHYDSQITAELVNGEVTGRFRKRRGSNKWGEMEFTAKRISQPDTTRSPIDIKPYFTLAGRWSMQFSKSDDRSIGVFAVRKNDQQPWGTFLTTTGDYRYLASQSSTKPNSLELSVFDGAHAFLFRIRQSGHEIRGDFWSGTTWHETFTGQRDAAAELPDAFLLTTVLKGVNLNDIRYPDLTGKLVSLGDKRFAGKARIIQVFGSWCPNCHDAALYLSELHSRYHKDGLSIVGLAFEHTGEFDRDAEMVRRYIKRHNTKYPVLIAGLSDKAKATQQFPLLDKVRSYPTTIFVRADGSIRAVYTGFSGPATGQAHKKLRHRFEEVIDDLLR